MVVFAWRPKIRVAYHENGFSPSKKTARPLFQIPQKKKAQPMRQFLTPNKKKAIWGGGVIPCIPEIVTRYEGNTQSIFRIPN
jgi:hypothetical protein